MRASDSTPTIGVILAGGRGRRFGGLDKSFLNLAGKPLIVHVIDRIKPQVSELVINTNGDNRGHHECGLRVCVDRPRPIPANGPLVGLTTVFTEAREKGEGSSKVLSVPVDTPFLPVDLVRRLSTSLGETRALVAYAASVERDHPIIALWSPQARDPVCSLFDSHPNISLHGIMERMRGVRVVFGGNPINPFFNINSRHDLEAAERLVRPAHHSG
jgi:molybdenum cofactor guanylyltransferase